MEKCRNQAEKYKGVTPLLPRGDALPLYHRLSAGNADLSFGDHAQFHRGQQITVQFNADFVVARLT